MAEADTSKRCIAGLVLGEYVLSIEKLGFEGEKLKAILSGLDSKSPVVIARAALYALQMVTHIEIDVMKTGKTSPKDIQSFEGIIELQTRAEHFMCKGYLGSTQSVYLALMPSCEGCPLYRSEI